MISQVFETIDVISLYLFSRKNLAHLRGRVQNSYLSYLPILFSKFYLDNDVIVGQINYFSYEISQLLFLQMLP